MHNTHLNPPPTIQEKYGRSLTHSAVALCPELRLQRKLSTAEVRNIKRSRDRQIRNKENTVLSQIIPRQLLASSTGSVASYVKRRKEQYFERPKQPNKVRHHSSPTDSSHWDVSAAIAMLNNWPAGHTINWSAEAQKLGITGPNRGQVLKETAARHGINTVALDGRTTRRIRGMKRRLPGSDISVGSGPTKKALHSAWAEMIQSG